MVAGRTHWRFRDVLENVLFLLSLHIEASGNVRGTNTGLIILSLSFHGNRMTPSLSSSGSMEVYTSSAGFI